MITSSEAFFAGAVQGITEFLPVSSSAHVSLFLRSFDIHYPGKIFDVFLNAGTLLTIFVFFRRQVLNMFLGGVNFICNRKTDNRDFFVTIALSSLPTIIVFGITDFLKTDINSPLITSILMIVFAAILYFCDRKPADREGISRRDSLIVGLVQPLSFIPGISRLGICLSVMRYLKYSREESFTYSMLLSVPPVAGACCLKLLQILLGKTVADNPGAMAAGTVAAFVFGMISISLTVKFLKNHTFLLIIIYRFLFGLFMLFS
jgi:undecaprenyl-diphosphatase